MSEFRGKQKSIFILSLNESFILFWMEINMVWFHLLKWRLVWKVSGSVAVCLVVLGLSALVWQLLVQWLLVWRLLVGHLAVHATLAKIKIVLTRQDKLPLTNSIPPTWTILISLYTTPYHDGFFFQKPPYVYHHTPLPLFSP